MTLLGLVTGMAYEALPPKYLRVLNKLRERIENGTYGPGVALPTEAALSTEFRVSRATVLRALGILKQDGWIESHQGRGSFVRGRPPVGRTLPRYARDVLDVDEAISGEVLHVGPVLAAPRIAAALGIPEGTPVYERRRRSVAESGPVDLVSVFVPVEVAVGTEITKPEPIGEGLAEHIESRKGLRGDYVNEWLTARWPTPEEAKLLDLGEQAPVLAVVLALYTASGEPVMAAVLVLPGNLHEIEDSYPVS